jgi:Zn-dependent protease/CBS domain-containing protein
MFGRGFRLPFKLWGIPLYLDITFLIVLPFFAWVIGRAIQQDVLPLALGVDERWRVGWMPFLLGFIAAIGLFVSVVLHELGHSIVAQKYGVKVKSITLWLLGGVAQFEEMPRQRGAEAVVAIAGPIVSIAIGLVCWALLQPVPVDWPAVRFVLGYLAVMNIVLAVFNMIPALPLDGGRVLRSLLALRMSHMRATQLSAGISKFFALALGLLGILPPINPWMIVLALFIYMAVNAETQNSLIVEMLEGLRVNDLMNPEVRTVPPDMPIAQLGQVMLQEHHLGFPVLDPSGHIVGIVTIRNMQGADQNAAVRDIMQPEVTTIREGAPAIDAFQAMSKNNFGRLVVVNPSGHMSGIITKSDLMRAIQIRSAGLAFGGEDEEEPSFTPAPAGR